MRSSVMKLAWRVCAAAATSMLLTAACAAQAADQKLLVRMDYSPWGMHAAMHLARQKGWFQEAGLDVEVQDGTGTINTLQLLAAGQADVGQVQLGTMAVARENGLELMSIAGFARKGDLAVMVDEKLGVKSVQDLIGKKLVCFTTSPWAPFIDPYFKANGIAKGKASIVMVSPAAMISTYASGNSDGFLSQAPFGQLMVSKVRPAKALLLSDSGINFPSYGLVATPQRLAEKGAAIRKFTQIQVRAWEYIYNGHIDEGVAAIQAQRPNVKLDPQILQAQIRAYRPFFDSPTQKSLPFGRQDDADWAAAIRSMEQAGMIKPGHKPADYYTNAMLAN
ncbi:ABC transporter substrate-binding protein [Cupriavidus sp. WS]|uniref:ABC transporter substrate-binding protein n=1 Tax=Cupriavidus sp. WS TaxID=1312922 RepID=UPI00039A8992|nr:ABC transporter substrate-binding protein [Cupriavidus sp. WS]